MSQIQHALQRVKRVLKISSFCSRMLSTAVVFFGFAVGLTFFSFPIFYAFIPAGVYFIYPKKKKQQLGFGAVEEKIPELEWRLRTSADNVQRHDELALSLHRDVLQNVQKVTMSTFLTNKGTVTKFVSIIGLILLIGIVQTQDLTFQEITPKIKNNIITGMFNKEPVNLSKYEEDEDTPPDSLFGKRSVAQYGNKEELLKLQQLGGVVDPTKHNPDGTGKTFNKESSGKAGEVVGTDTSTEKINEQDKAIINNYFKKIYQGE